MTVSEEVASRIRTVHGFPKPGIAFKDIVPLLADPVLCDRLAEEMVLPFRDAGIDMIAGIESRGFIFGSLMAQKLNCGLTLVRKRGKLPYRTVAAEYELEYGSAVIEMHEDSFIPGSKVLIHDDLLATGGTAAATAQLCGELEAKLIGFSFIIELPGLNGRSVLQPYSENTVSIVKY